MIRTSLACFVAGLAVALGLTSSTPAQQGPVDVRIVFAVDTSYSVNVSEFTLQKQGMAEAFRHPDVLAAIRGGAYQRIAVMVFQWAQFNRQHVALPWMIIDGPASAEQAARLIENADRSGIVGNTSLSGAIRRGLEELSVSKGMGGRVAIDISADGQNNHGPDVEVWRDVAGSLGVTVNGLAIENEVINMRRYMADHVITGPGAFVQPLGRYEDFAEAFRRKFIREIEGTPVS